MMSNNKQSTNKVISQFFLGFSFLFIPSGCSQDIKKLFLIGTIVAFIFYYASNITFPGGADHFLKYADALITGSKLQDALAQRDIGYPLMILLSGYHYTQSIIGVIFLQAIMAILMPITCYLAIRPYFPKCAYFTGLALILSLNPFIYMKWIHHDQTFMFFQVLSIAFLNLFLVTKRTGYLYAMTGAVILTSLARPAGNLSFPIFILLAFWFCRGGIWRYIFCILAFLVIISGYKLHRDNTFKLDKYNHQASYTGEQIFYNLYINSKEYNILLDPNIGPYMKLITDGVYQQVLPSPAHSAKFKKIMGFESPAFLDTYFYKYDAQAFLHQLYLLPNWEYYAFMCDVVPDNFFLKASWEIVWQYPWYPFAFALRNSWHLLYEPGFAHTRFNVNSFSKTGIDNAFAVSTVMPDYSRWKGYIPDRVLREISTDYLQNSTELKQKFLFKCKYYYIKYFDMLIKGLFYLMLTAWFAAIVGALSIISKSNKLNRLAELLNAKNIYPAIVSVSAVLFMNILITAAFGEPDYRYHNFIMPLKLIIAGFAIGVLTRVCLYSFKHGVMRLKKYFIGSI